MEDIIGQEIRIINILAIMFLGSDIIIITKLKIYDSIIMIVMIKMHMPTLQVSILPLGLA